MEEQQNKRIRRTSVEIKKLLNEFTEGTVNAKEFCMLHNITEAVFYKWRSRYSDTVSANRDGFFTIKQARSSSAPNATTLFAEVNGIRIYQPVAASYLKEILV